MKIALVVESLDAQRGGVEQWTSQFAVALVEAGHEVHAVAHHVPTDLRRRGIVAHPIPATPTRLARGEAIAELLRRQSFDVIHDMGIGWYADVLQPHGGSWIASFSGKLAWLPPWRRAVKERLRGWLPRYRDFAAVAERQYRRGGPHVVALSRMVAHDLARFHQVEPERISVVYNGVDTRRFTPDDRPRYRAAVRRQLAIVDGDVLLLLVAQNLRLKGLPALLEATSRLRRSGLPVRLLVVGGRRLHGWARRAAGRAAGAVRFVGSVRDPRPFYAAADLYVHPTWYDPCSLVVLEALACGLPVITSERNGVAELIGEGRQGSIMQSPGNVDELVTRLRRLIELDDRSPLEHAARQLALEHSFERNVTQLLDVYGQVGCGSQQRRAA